MVHSKMKFCAKKERIRSLYLTFPAILTDAFIADHILASLTSISNRTCASEILVRVVNTSSAISAGLVVGAIMLVCKNKTTQ